MNTLEFLQTILPEEGYKFVGLSRAGVPGIAHKAYESLEVMAEAIASYNKQPNLTVYHACAAYKAPYFEAEVNGEIKRKYRGEPNWLKAKSFWCDIDCGADKAAEGKGYADKPAAAKAIRGFCLDNNFPMPMIVDSGGGIHCYWPLTRAVGPKSWCRMADGFKGVLKAAGVLADPTRTADLSSVLRPVGSHNRKPGRDPREVLAKTRANPVEPEVFAESVAKAMQAFAVLPPPVRYDPNLNDDLISHLGPQLESSAEEVANHCAQVAAMRDTKGDVNYDHWRGVIGIIKHCVEGYDLAVDWSTERAATGHSNTDVLTRYETWSSGPATCEFFQGCNASACSGCPHSGKIKSPIVLGRVIPEPAEIEVPAQTEDEQATTITVPPLPEGFAWNNNFMVRMLPDPNGVTQSYKFCSSLFYPIQRIRKADHTYAFTMRMHLPDQRVRDFEVDTAALAAASDLLKALSRYELMPTNNKDASMHLTAYIRDSVFKLMNEQREVDTLTSFGWLDDMSGFLLGDRLYHKDGSVRRVFIGGSASEHKAALPDPRGTVEAYSEAVNFVYNREHSQAAQYAFCSAYGSLLTPFGEDSYNGILMCIVSGKSGRGKTTVGAAARYGMGDATKMTFAGKAGATWNARWAILGAFRNIPVVFDEMTDMDASQFSEMAYTISQGSDKARLNSTGGRVGFADRHTWAQSPDLTANEDMLAKLAQHNANTQAEAMRVLQVNFGRYEVPIIEPSTLVSRALEQMRNNMGCAGDALMKYVVANQDAVRALFEKNEHRLTKKLPESEFRFYRNHAACTLTAAQLLINLNIVAFDFDKLEAFTYDLLQDQIDLVRAGNMTNPGDALTRMVRDLSGRIIVTMGYRDVRTDARGPEDSLSRIIGIPAGRRVLGSPNPSSTEKVDPKVVGKLFVTKKDFNDWCSKNRMEPKEIIAFAQTAGWLTTWSEKFNIGRGTAHSTGACACFVFDFNAMEGTSEKTAGPALVATAESAVSSAR
jgi:hypothetical protein